jgi:hypothetical protein
VRSRTGEAVDPELRQAPERTEVRFEGRNLCLAAELQEDVVRSEVVDLDGQLRAHTEQVLQLFRLFERLPVRNRLFHPAEHDARAFALERDGITPASVSSRISVSWSGAPSTNAEPRTGCPRRAAPLSA